MLFADLGNSTRLYEELGDRRAHEIATGCLNQLEEIVRNSGGRIIKHIGDEVMCVFPDANDAVTAACEMEECISAPTDELGLTVHIGVHWGSVLVEGDDVFGDAVNLAARIVGLAHQRQILTTDATVQMLRPELKESSRLVDRRHVKGKQADIDVYEIVWEESEERTEFRGMVSASPSVAQLKIMMGPTEIFTEKDKPVVTIGRSPGCDLVIADPLASRKHAKIERQIDKWVLTDFSSNGTIVALDDGGWVLVHNEEILLPNSGWLGIGTHTPDTYELPVRFEQLLT